MKRDGITLSLWQDTINDAECTSSATRSHYDVIIIGAGITGVSTALALQKAGKKCLLLESNGLGFGTTGGTSAHLNTVLDQPYYQIIKDHGQETARLTALGITHALQRIADNVDEYGLDCKFVLCNGYMYATNAAEEEELEKVREGIEAVGLSVEYAADLPAPMSYTKAIKFADQGFFHPLQYIRGLWKALRNLGGAYMEGQTVEKVVDDHSMQRVLTDKAGDYTADYVVYATHTPPGVHLLTFKLAPYRSYVMAFDLGMAAVYPKDLMYDLKEPFHYFRKAKYPEGELLLVGGQDHKTGHGGNAAFNFTSLEAFVKKYYPEAKKVYQWSSQFYDSTDGLPYIGYFPGNKNKRQFVATGFSGNGMMYGTLAAQIIADLILKGTSIYEDIFSPSRVKPIAGFQHFVKENVDAVKHFVGDRIAIPNIESLVNIAKGEGVVVNLEHQQVGVFRDQEGHLHGVNPVCKHAGCIVQWNNAEKSWDCPCHGARYTPDGSLITGPSTQGLDKFSL